MSSSQLIEDLRAKGRERIDRIWQEARREAARLAEEEDLKLASVENGCMIEAGRARQAVKRRQMVSSQRQASAIITRAEQELNDRLFRLAEDRLGQVWQGSRGDLLARLVSELPDGGWQTIRIHPDDEAAARQVFPEAEIVIDPEIRGGLVVTSRCGGVTVINTLRKRLERAWPWLGQEILRELVENEKPG